MRARIDFGFIGAVTAHIAVVLATKYILERNEDAVWRFPVAAVPIVTLVLVLLTGASMFRRQADELNQRIGMEALTFAFLGTFVVTMSYGALQQVGLPDLHWHWVPVPMVALWLVGLTIAQRRYR